MSFGLPDKRRDEDMEDLHEGCEDRGGICDCRSAGQPCYVTETRAQDDDASEWSPEPFLDKLGDEPVTLEELVAYLEDMDLIEANALQHGATIPVEKLLSNVKKRRGK